MKSFQVKIHLGLLSVFVVFFLVWWLLINLTPLGDNYTFREFFSYTYGLTALYGAIIGWIISRQWGGVKSIVGKAIFSFSTGLFLQELGQLTYSYQIYILAIENPYPSIGDVFFFSTHFFYAYGIWMIGNASGVKLSLQQAKGKIISFVIPSLMLLFAYLSLLHNYEFNWESPISSFFDFGYPAVQAIYISATIMTYVLSKKWLGGKMKNTILLVFFVFVVQYISDFTFVYQVYNETWELSGSNDLFYFITYSLMTYALIRFEVAHYRLSSTKE